MPRMVFSQQVIHDGVSEENIPSMPDNITDFPTVLCSADECDNYKSLRKCTRCKSAYYCSVECQRKDWKHHKAACNMNVTSQLTSGVLGANEPPLRRHLRHWTARFENSLICAAIVGMNLHRSFSNVDNYGMVIHLSPRPHAITGARYFIESCEVVSMEEFKGILGDCGMTTVLAQHQKERDLLKTKSGGEKDFAACVVFAANTGPWKLDGEHNIEIRFKPLCIHKGRTRSPQLNDPTFAWLQTLKMQIQQDLPARTMTS